MIFVGTLAQFQLSQILQLLERYGKTGLLTVARGQQKVSMYFRQGQLMCIEPQQEYDPLERRLLRAGAISRYDLQDVEFEMSRTFLGNPGRAYRSEIQMALALTESGLMSHEQLYACVRQEDTEILRELLTWSEGEVSFAEGVKPPGDRLPLTLSITSLLPSLSDPISPSSVSTSNLRSVREEPSLPVTPPSIPTTPHPFLFKKSKPGPIEEEPSTPAMQFPTIPTMLEASRPALQERLGPATPVSTFNNIGTPFQRGIVLSSVTSSIHPSPNALTLKHPTPGMRFKKHLTVHASKKRYRVFTGVLLLFVFFLPGALASPYPH